MKFWSCDILAEVNEHQFLDVHSIDLIREWAYGIDIWYLNNCYKNWTLFHTFFGAIPNFACWSLNPTAISYQHQTTRRSRIIPVALVSGVAKVKILRNLWLSNWVTKTLLIKHVFVKKSNPMLNNFNLICR